MVTGHVFQEMDRDEIFDIIKQMFANLDESATREKVICACVAATLILQKPDIDPEQLRHGMKQASEFIAFYITEIENTGKPLDSSKEKAN